MNYFVQPHIISVGNRNYIHSCETNRETSLFAFWQSFLIFLFENNRVTFNKNNIPVKSDAIIFEKENLKWLPKCIYYM